MQSPTKGLLSAEVVQAHTRKGNHRTQTFIFVYRTILGNNNFGKFSDRYQAAVIEAKKVDIELQNCRSDEEKMEKIRLTTPFLGVPITTKNALAVKGESTFQLEAQTGWLNGLLFPVLYSTGLGNESGLCLKRGMKAAEDSHAISVMRASGAIIIAVTNTPEMCLWIESDNNLFGRTSNPYNTQRTCGGSSGERYSF